MAVMANGSNGHGHGKTFIAADSDLIVNNLSANLDNAISFVRVVPWKNSLKKGLGRQSERGGYSADEIIKAIEPGWFYDWGGTPGYGRTRMQWEYVPMSWGPGGADASSIARYQGMTEATHLLGFNEPDYPDAQSGQYDNLYQVPVAVKYYKNLQEAGLRLGSPAPHEENSGGPRGWLTRFMNQAGAADIRVDFVAIHWYDWGSGPKNSPNADPHQVFLRFQKYVSVAYHRYKKPVWITEFNANPNRVRSVHDAFLREALPYLESLGYVERYAYFQPFGGNGDFIANGSLTSTGEIYKNQVSGPAYTQPGLPSSWASQDVGTVASAGDAFHADGIFTVCGTGAGISGSADEFHYVYQARTGNFEIIASVGHPVSWTDDSKGGVMFRETLNAGSKHAIMSVTSGKGASFDYRDSTDETTASCTSPGITAPHWVKLVRSGDTFSGYTSPDGNGWTLVKSQTIHMADTAYVGLAVSSHSDGNFTDTIFNNVEIRPHIKPESATEVSGIPGPVPEEGSNTFNIQLNGTPASHAMNQQHRSERRQ